jgi:hypothetical protein
MARGLSIENKLMRARQADGGADNVPSSKTSVGTVDTCTKGR